MTVNYIGDVATTRGLGCFWKILWRWKGSVYKLLMYDLVAYCTVYYMIWLMYRHVLSPHQMENFEAVVRYCKHYSNFFPISFVLGFFVSTIMTRWWNQYTSIPWPTALAVYVSSTLHGQDEVGRAMRRTIMRYVCVSTTIIFRILSPRVKKRFPVNDDLVSAGLLHDNEKEIIGDLERSFPGISLYWMPIVWAATIVTKARQIGRIRDDFAVKTIVDELNKIRGNLGTLNSYHNVSIPLVYTQVVTIAVYSYFITSLLANQDIPPHGDEKRQNFGYFPIFTILQFMFYMGWLKVAEQLMNPFGEDEDDFDVNSMIDKNLQMSYLIVDDMHNEHPTILKDKYWEEVPSELPDIGKTSKEMKEASAPSSTLSVLTVENMGRKSVSRRQSFIPTKVKISNFPVVQESSSEATIAIDPSLIPRTSTIESVLDRSSEEFENLKHLRTSQRLSRLSKRISVVDPDRKKDSDTEEKDDKDKKQ